MGAPSPLSKISSLKDGPEKRSFPKAGRLETIAQMDGNESVASESESEEEEGGNENVNDDESVSEETEDVQNIEVIVGQRPIKKQIYVARNPARKVIRRDEGLVEALTLPSITLFNMRSIWPKIGNLADDINLRETDLCFLTEIWEKSENKKHQYSIEEMLEMKNINYISSPRPGSKRGGGVAIAFSRENFQVSKLNIDVPKPLECLFALVKPNTTVGKMRKIIAICFYCPPRSKAKRAVPCEKDKF